MEETPAFDSAVEQLQRFLAEQGWRSKIIWRVEEDVVRVPGDRIVVRHRPMPEAAESAREHYETGRQRGVGVALNVSCEVQGAACTTIYWTTDSTEAEYRLMPDRGLKLSIVTPRRQGRSVGWLSWWLAKRKARLWSAAFSRSYRRAAQQAVAADDPAAGKSE